MWWDEHPDERYWIEIRRVEGIGSYLECPNRDDQGNRSGWYELVAQVRKDDVIYHYNARESRFVGRSLAAEDAWEDSGAYGAKLKGFTPIVAPVGLQEIRGNANAIYALRDKLLAAYGSPLYLPFQFTEDRSQLRMIQDYFAKLPREVIEVLFSEEDATESQNSPDHPSTFLDPFKPKADADYTTNIIGGPQMRTKSHETLVNNCACWLAGQGLDPGRNAAVDLGTLAPKAIIEAKVVSSWPASIREALGQLYEYRYFKVCEPGARLIFLADQPVPSNWVQYLESDRGIGVMWPVGKEFEMSSHARQSLGL